MKQKFNLREFASQALLAMMDSTLDAIITAVVTGFALSIIQKVAHPYYLQFIPGLYILGMIVALVIRITHRFDDSYTTDEVGNMLRDLKEQVNRLERNT